MTGFGYHVKKALPAPLLQAARDWKSGIWRLLHPAPAHPLPLEDQFPWCSPDVWQRVVDSYLSVPQPKVFEYGTGVSSIWHIRNLLAEGGTYIGVEHDLDWYAQVLQAVLRYGVRHGLLVACSSQPVTMPDDFPVPANDAFLKLSGPQITGCEVVLKLRLPFNRSRDADGTLAEFREYVKALDEPCDVVIVDGRARKACVNHALDLALLKPGGSLVLMEAGRGVEGWLGWPASSGTSDYQPEVERMLALGGELVDGSGVDRWPGLKRRRTPISNAYSYPLEACFLRLPTSSRHQQRLRSEPSPLGYGSLGKRGVSVW